MGKVRTRILGMEDVEEKQKKKQKIRLEEKKLEKKVEKKQAVKDVALDEKTALNEAKLGVKDESPAEVKKEKKAKKTQETKARVRGKKYLAALRIRSEKATKALSMSEALELLKKIKYVAFDESVEIHANLVKEGLRGEVALPHSTGKEVRVAIVDEALLEAISKGKIEFDILVSHPSFMPKLARFAKVLGPRGLMPSPKVGTISDKPQEAAKKFTSGIIRWKAEAKFPLIHLLIGKISFEEKKITENVAAYVAAIGKDNIKDLWIKTSMSPSVQLKVEELAG